jgi:hypothetical protein
MYNHAGRCFPGLRYAKVEAASLVPNRLSVLSVKRSLFAVAVVYLRCSERRWNLKTGLGGSVQGHLTRLCFNLGLSFDEQLFLPPNTLADT